MVLLVRRGAAALQPRVHLRTRHVELPHRLCQLQGHRRAEVRRGRRGRRVVLAHALHRWVRDGDRRVLTVVEQHAAHRVGRAQRNVALACRPPGYSPLDLATVVLAEADDTLLLPDGLAKNCPISAVLDGRQASYRLAIHNRLPDVDRSRCQRHRSLRRAQTPQVCEQRGIRPLWHRAERLDLCNLGSLPALLLGLAQALAAPCKGSSKRGHLDAQVSS